MKLKLQKKKIKTLSPNSQTLPIAQTNQVAGGTSVGSVDYTNGAVCDWLFSNGGAVMCKPQ